MRKSVYVSVNEKSLRSCFVRLLAIVCHIVSKGYQTRSSGIVGEACPLRVDVAIAVSDSCLIFCTVNSAVSGQHMKSSVER